MNREKQPLDVRVEGLVVVLLGDAPQRNKSTNSDIGEEDINSAFCSDVFIEAIKVNQVRDVAPNACDVAAYCSYCLFKLFLATAGNKNMSTLAGEELCRSEADTLGTASNDRHFPLQPTHGSLSQRRIVGERPVLGHTTSVWAAYRCGSCTKRRVTSSRVWLTAPIRAMSSAVRLPLKPAVVITPSRTYV